MMKRVLFLFLFISFLNVDATAVTSISHLTVEGRTEPLGLDVNEPRFGWRILSDKKNIVQKSYRIIIASSRERIDRNIGDVWDSGTVKSDSSQWVSYKGKPLQPNRDYYWKVTVNVNKEKTAMSASSRWSTGLLLPDNWCGEWIGLDSLMSGERLDRHGVLASRYLRKSFNIAKPVRRAVIHISGLGNYVLYINGQRVGDDVLTPLPTEYSRTVAYDTYDITSLIGRDNAVGVALAGGHYLGMVQNYQTNVRTSYGLPRLIADLFIDYEDGSSDTIVTDKTWRITADGPVRNASGYDGELYDARKELGKWTEPEYNDSRWSVACVMKSPGGRLRGGLAPNMHIYQTDSPVSIRRFGRRYIVDFGTNGAGRIRLRLCGNVGDSVRIRHAELLDAGDSTLYVANLRGAEAANIYVSNGKPADYAPDFTYYGFRYAEITGVSDLNVEDIKRELIADRMDDAENCFSVIDASGNNMLNRIVDNARRGIRSNYKGMPVDCPQRDERMPWLGDRTTGCLGESYMMNNHALYAKWTGDICDSQRPDGNISDVSPAYWRLYNGNVTWPAALLFSCDMLYRQYGDLRPMRSCYGAFKNFLMYVRNKHYADGLVTYDRYGDWCVPPESPKLVHSKDPARQTDGKLIASAYYYYLCKMMQRYAVKVGNAADEKFFGSEADVTLRAVNDSFLVSDTYSNGTATANLLPLAMNMVPAGARAAVSGCLIATITEKNDTHVCAGVIGIQWLMRYLSESGYGDIAYRMAVTDTYPGWGYMVRKGATTIWELWNGDTANPSMNSGNHVMLLGDLLPWCYEYIAGIRPDESLPGFKHVMIKPDYSITGICGASASHSSPYGVIKSSWKRAGGKTCITVTVPPNTTAEVYLPSGKVKRIGSGTYTF